MVEVTNENQIKNAPTSVLLSTANDIVADLVKDSTLFDDAKLQAVTRFQHKEVQTGRIIGRGGFCTVKEIISIRNAKEKRSKMMWASRRKSGGSRMNVTSPKKQKHQERLDMSYNGVEMSVKEYMTYSANRGGKTRYVIKSVAEEWVYQNRLTYLKGTVDLALEAKYLSTLAHPHIIELRGLSQSGPFNEGFFLVLDRLNDTLPSQLKKWMTIDRQCKGITGAFTGGKKKIAALFVDRMKAAYGIANALNYLHSMNLVYRDLKPDNIGFDLRGTVKMFDFGLCKELNKRDEVEEGLYKMTGFTGSIRYMAPEVGLRRPYNQSVDVYSFSMLMWYIMALEPPYGFYTPEMFVSRVFKQGHRPVTMATWPAALCQLMKRSWDNQISVRPNFEIIMEVIRREVEECNHEVASKLVPYVPAPPNPNNGAFPPLNNGGGLVQTPIPQM